MQLVDYMEDFKTEEAVVHKMELSLEQKTLHQTERQQ